MDNRKDIDELLKSLEEIFGKILEDIDRSDRPVDICVSVNVFPLVVFNGNASCIKKHGNVPVDILETDEQIHTVVALPGIDPEMIRLNCDGHTLEITTNDADKVLQETIELPAAVIKSGMKATYVNGILEVIFNKSKKKKDCKKE